MTLRVAAERDKELTIGADRFRVGTQPSDIELRLPAGTPARDVINNAGGVVLREGYGADRGFQQIDRGQFDEPEEVFTACGNGLAIRTEPRRDRRLVRRRLLHVLRGRRPVLARPGPRLVDPLPARCGAATHPRGEQQ